MIRASVIVPHFNDPIGLDRCLGALAAQTLTAETFEIIVADNASTLPAGELDRIVAHRARLVVESKSGAGPARNAGVRAARGGILAFTDADCIPEPGWLAALCAALEHDDVAGGRMRVLAAPPRERSGSESFELVFAFDNRTYVLKKGFSVTANMACTRAAFDCVGDFRNGVPEDADWGRRAGALGLRIGYAPGAVVWHPARADWIALRRKWHRLNREAFTLMRDGRWGRLRWAVRTLALPATILAHAPRVMRHPELSGARERLRALGVLARLRLWRTADAFRLLCASPRRAA